MHVFHIKGLSGIFMAILATVGMLLVTVGFPTAFMLVLWNAVVFEGFAGPEINFTQALILWAATLTLLNAIFKPEIKFQMKNLGDNSPDSK